MFIRLQFRRDTAAAWASANPTLASGELGIETDTQKFKLGDGSTAWASLAYGGIKGDQGIQGIQGVQGATGATGAPGSVWRDGSGAPSNSLGIDGDYYLDDATGNVYKRASGTYSIVGSIKGPQGEQGIQGPAGANATPSGADTQVQFNDGGAFGGDSGFTFNRTLKTIALAGATLTAVSSPIIDMAQAWNNAAVAFTALKLNVTDTASAGGSLLADLQVGGASKFSVSKAGLITATAGGILVSGTNSSGANSSWWVGAQLNLSGASGILSFGTTAFVTQKGAANLRFGAADAASPIAQTLSVQSAAAGNTNVAGTDLTIEGSAGTGSGAGGSIIFKVAPAGSSGTAQNALATALTIDPSLGGNGVAFSVSAGRFQITTGASITSLNSAFGLLLNNDSARLSFGISSDLSLARDAANTLAQRNGTNAQELRVYGTYANSGTDYERAVIKVNAATGVIIGNEVGGTGFVRGIYFQTGGLTGWSVSPSRHFLAGADNTYDIGAYGANRPRNIYAAGQYVGGSHITAAAGAYIGWDGRLTLYSPAAGMLGFAGSTSSFPALKRSSAELQARLADDSGYTTMDAQLRMQGTAPASATATGTAGDVRYDSGYIYVCTAANTWVRAALSTW